MSRKRPILRLLLLLIALASTASFAQQSRVDTIVHRLTSCKTPKGIDTLTLRNMLPYISDTKVTDEQVKQIETAAGLFNQGTDEDLSYLIKSYIIDAVLLTDPDKGIDYGKRIVADLEKSKTPHAIQFKSFFLWVIRRAYRNSKRLPEGIYYYSEKLSRYKMANDSSGLATCHFVLSGFYNVTGLLDQAIYAVQKSLSYMDTLASHDVDFLGTPNLRGKEYWLDNAGVLANYLLQKGEYQQSLYYSTIVFNEWQRKKAPLSYQSQNIALARLLTNRLDSVAYFLNIGITDALDRKLYFKLPSILQVEALYKLKTGKLAEAEALLNRCWQLIKQYDISYNTPTGTAAPDYYLALIRIQQKRFEQAAQLLTSDIGRVGNQRLDKLRDYKLLAEVYDKVGNFKQTAQAYQAFIRLQDSLLTDQARFRSISFDIEQQMNDKDRSITKLQRDQAIDSLYRKFTIGIAVLLLLLAATLYYRFISKQRANAILEKTLAKLNTTQTQLIQKEKLASLGELTAGIAHEIQNPLNFVNNFSEVSAELVSELKEGLDRGDTDEAKALADDLMSNIQKIHHHGSRASSIVKGMLEHSRTESGEKRPTDLNALADEYLKIAYHGLRANNQAFNCELVTDFAPTLQPVDVVPQEIGRVLLNLYNNAFYAVSERRSECTTPGVPANSLAEDYQPTVRVCTKRVRNGIEICVSDNGTGMPEAVKGKIFQPFFTTKPTGEGTGLGLSLSYDIITKGHAGTLTVDSTEGQGTNLVITLPID